MCLPAAAVLGAWEAGEAASPVERALAVAERAAPDGEHVAEWSIGRRDALLLDVHDATFGGEIVLVTACPACAEALELAFGAAQIRSPWGAADAVNELQAGGVRLTFRLPVSADLLAVADLADAHTARCALVERCVLDARRDGTPVPAGDLPEETVRALAARAARLDPQADIELSLSCAECGHGWSTTFDVAGHVWGVLAARARSLLAEVAALAAAFGWTEHEVLRLPEGRRRRYLDLAGA
jgi:hypothetical protein